MTSSPTLSSQQRENVLRAYRSRGRRDQQMYLSYSVKTERDLILSSNYRFLHWLLYLEVDPDVITFELRDNIATDNNRIQLGNSVHAWATMRDRRIVGHRIVADECSESDKSASALSPEESREGEVRLILQSDLRTNASLAMRYAKVVCFAAALRDQRLDAPTLLLTEFARSAEKGTVRQLLDAMPDTDDAITKGLIARLAVTGWLRLDLSRQGYTPDSRWEWGGAS